MFLDKIFVMGRKCTVLVICIFLYLETCFINSRLVWVSRLIGEFSTVCYVNIKVMYISSA